MVRISLWACLFLLSLSAVQAAGEPALKSKAHPYLLYTPQRIEVLKQRMETQPEFSKAWNNILAEATALLAEGRPKIEALETLGLAYCMTKDQRFADKARDVMLYECRRDRWVGPSMLRRDPPWKSELGTAWICYNMALGFDSVYDALSEEEREIVVDGLIRLGIRPILDDWLLGDTRIHALDTMGHNWWSACVFMAGFGSMAVMEDEPQAVQWLQQIDEASVEWFNYAGSELSTKPANFDRAGGLYESVNYAAYAMSEYLKYRMAWQNALTAPPREIPMLDKAGDFFINVCYPNDEGLMSLNFGDGSLHANGSRAVLWLWAMGDRKPRNLWYLNQTGRVAFREGVRMDDPLGLVYYPEARELAEAPAEPDLPPSTLFSDMDWAMLRSSWQNDATLLGVKSGFTWNHAHADAGSFILFHKGKNLLVDSGNCSYGRPEYDDYYRQSRAHNIMLFNGHAENPEDTYYGSQYPGLVSHLMDTGDLKYVMANATGPTSRTFIRNFRHFLWIGDVILVIDDVKSFEPGQFSWLLHYEGQANRRGLDVHVTDGEASVRVRPLFPMPFPDAGLPTDYPENMRLVELAGLKDHAPDVEITYYAFEPSELTRQASFITAILLSDETGGPQLERLQSENHIGVRIRQNGKITDVYLNMLAQGRIRHRNSCITINGWETDAYLWATTFPDGSNPADPDAAERTFIANGSYLRRGGTVVFDSLSRVFLTATNDGGQWDILLQGQPTINARLRSGVAPKKVFLNGDAVNPPYDRDTQTFKLRSRSRSGCD